MFWLFIDTLLKKAAQVARLAGELVFPSKCASCGCEIEEGLFCPACRRGLSHKGLLHRGDVLAGVYNVFAYEQGIKSAIHQIKFAGNTRLPGLLGEELAAGLSLGELQQAFGKMEMLISSIPTDEKRRQERGFDLPEEMFTPFLQQNKLDRVTLLKRVRPTLPMFELTPEERRLNLQDCFKPVRSVSGKNILLLDDIFTTGATMEEAARVLKASGAVKVWGLSFCSAMDNLQ